MSPAVPLLLLMLLTASQKTQLELRPRDENTDVGVLCADPSVVMNFSNLNLGSIGKHFITSPIITCLDLKQNGIQDVEVEAFDGVPNLRYLQMSLNSLHIYGHYNNIFVNSFEHLEVLILDDMSYSYSHIVTFNSILPQLRRLFLRNSAINSLNVNSEGIFPSLTHLYLSDNFLYQDEFSWLPGNLEYLDLTGNNLEILTLKNLYNLERIFIDRSRERSLHSILFENLGNLKYLSASSNRISGISFKTFLNISSLLYLDLSDNEIEYIEGGSFDAMSELQFLNLSSNAINIIQGGIFEKLSKLKTLILEKNYVTMFPMIGNPTALETISLNCNKIKTIIGGTFAKMPLLEKLLLHGNEIINIDQEAFLGLEKLKVLTLSNNKLSVLPQYWMKPLSSLEELDLAGNQFINFGNLAFSKSLTLNNVYLSNQLLFIQTASLIDLPVNATINFDANFNFVEQC